MDYATRPDVQTASFGAGAARVAVKSSCGIAVMAKASVPGLTKTRLVPPLTHEEAAALNTAFLRDVAGNMLLAASQAAPHASIAGYAAFGPPGSEEFFQRHLPHSIGLIEAWLPNFGDCLHHTICEIFARGHAAAVVLNADSPTLPTALLNETAEALAQPGDRAVLGPSRDGGYYLLGLKAAHRRMFEDIAWSTARVAEETRERAREIGLDLHVLPTWYDVDDIETLRRLHSELRICAPANARPAAPDPAERPHHAPHTAELLGRLCPDGAWSRGPGGAMQVEEAGV
ncbi:MAG TPA: TIGR04282 family arsenosugar biosynthesis glycosyltransferase [Xanthobacteraceae bacterium]|nr:TIGR04282 family arsenosugar biosynthesis glycosyltransferase [Xanthobacteraceae bacterium]